MIYNRKQYIFSASFNFINTNNTRVKNDNLNEE